MLALLSTAAGADELLLMPYSCEFVGGQPVLTRSQETGHRVISPHEQRAFSACSPVNPGMCRQWHIHRFDLDCGGVRVPWISIAAAVDAQRGRRASVANGHLYLQMPVWWSVPPDDPCARAWGDGDARWRFGGLARYCAERGPPGPAATVEMPAGFAPLLGIQGVFVAAMPPSTAALPRTSSAPVPPPIASNPPAPKSAHSEPPRTPQPEPREAGKAPAKKPTAWSPATEPTGALPLPASPPTAAAPAPPVVPKILNRPDPAPSATPAGPPPAPPSELAKAPAPPAVSPPHGETPPEAAKADPMPPREGAPPSPQASEPVAGDNRPLPVALVSSARTTAAATAALMLASLAMLILGVFAFLRQRESARGSTQTLREFAAHSLEPRRDLVAASIPRPAKATRPGAQGRSDAIPRTRAEAFEVLGMSVTPDATEAAIKKIVDGLRLSWHPDHARGPADRETREQRVKQINAAWEIIMGKRAEA
jgi:hypothetical protein